jgi:hypothetical protein
MGSDRRRRYWGGGRCEVHAGFSLGNRKERDTFEEINRHGSAILK